MTKTIPESLLEALAYIENLLNDGQIGQALSFCEQLLVSHPQEKELLLLYAIALQIKGERKESLNILQKLAKSNADSSEIWNHYALILFEEHRFEEAHRTLQYSLELDPKNPFAWWLKSIFRTFQHDPQGSERAYLYARWLEPESYPPYPSFSESDLLSIFESIKEELSEKQQEICAMLFWNVLEIPTISHLEQLQTSPIIPLIFLESTQMTIHIFRQNIRRLGIEEETLSGILKEELIMALENSHFNTILA